MTSKIQRYYEMFRKLNKCVSPRDELRGVPVWCKSEDVEKLESDNELRQLEIAAGLTENDRLKREIAKRDVEIERLKKEKILGVQTITELKKRAERAEYKYRRALSDNSLRECKICGQTMMIGYACSKHREDDQ